LCLGLCAAQSLAQWVTNRVGAGSSDIRTLLPGREEQASACDLLLCPKAIAQGTDDFWARGASKAPATGDTRRSHDAQTTPTRRNSEMQKLIALVFHYSLNGLLADKGTEYYRFCFDLLDEAGGPSDDDQSLEFLQTASAHIMGRT